MDFYDGIGGIAFFLTLLKIKKYPVCNRMYRLILKKLFLFTDSNKSLESCKTGLLVGEGSIAFTIISYICLQRKIYLRIMPTNK